MFRVAKDGRNWCVLDDSGNKLIHGESYQVACNLEYALNNDANDCNEEDEVAEVILMRSNGYK